MSQMNSVHVLRANTISEVIRLLDENPFGDMIFRGVSDSSYPLLPSSLRKEGKVEISETTIPSFEVSNTRLYKDYISSTNEAINIINEELVLYFFYRAVNHHGLRVPNIDYFNRVIDPISIVMMTGKSKTWYGLDLEYLAALAQHYGLPTRMLDWTYDFYTALYFAAVGAAKKLIEEKESHIQNDFSVYFLPIHEVQHFVSRLRFVTPLYADNPNLNAQKGILSYWQCDRTDAMEIQEKSLDVLLDEYNDGIFLKAGKQILRIDFSYHLLPDILNYLFDRDLSGAKFYPGYSGVICEFKERQLEIAVRRLLKGANND